jgi:hypothetical protein
MQAYPVTMLTTLSCFGEIIDWEILLDVQTENQFPQRNKNYWDFKK